MFDTGEDDGEQILMEEFSLSSANSTTRAVNWRWLEIGEEDGMEAGDVLLTTFFGGQQEGLRIQNGDRGIETSVDLSFSTQATMNFSFRRKSFEADDAIRIEISTDDGATWQIVERLAGPVTDDNIQISTANLSPWVGHVVKVRFVSETNFSADARFYLDFVQIRHTVVKPELTYSVHLPYVVSPQPDAVNDMIVRAAGSVLTVRDEFNVTSYANNNGNTSWSTQWSETDPDGVAGPAGNDYVAVVSSKLRFHYAFQTESIQRSVDIADAQSATLSFDWQSLGLDWDEKLSLLISTSRNGPFTLLATFDGTNSNHYSVDITNFRSADTTIRFANLNRNWEWGEWVTLDNIQIEWTVADVPTAPPPTETTCTDCIDTTNLETVYPQVVGASDVWNEDVKKQGDGITIAILDSGISEHQDLTDKKGNSRILAHVDFTDGGGVIDDYHGHGTHVAWRSCR
ncbi:MAG: S8 family serine peptidase [Caldilineaceae bacterium]